MGVPSTTKFIKNSAGQLSEEAALTTSVGASDAQKIPALNASGVLDATIVNAATTSAGAGSAGKVVALDSAGRIDNTMLPVGLGPDTVTILTSEALSAGDWVNVHNVSGNARVRKADATVTGKEAMGFVLAGAGSGASATVYFEGTNTAVTGQTPGLVYLATTAGAGTTTAPSASANIVQAIGYAVSATAVNAQFQRPITLA
jgi:hypothetical protein